MVMKHLNGEISKSLHALVNRRHGGLLQSDASTQIVDSRETSEW